MNRRVLAITLLLPFLVLSVWAVAQVGVWGIFATASSPGGAQVFVDLVLALILLLTFLVPHARACGRNPWLWVALTLATGSIGALLYFATAPATAPATAAVAGREGGTAQRGGESSGAM